MPLGFDPPHPGGMADTSPTFKRWAILACPFGTKIAQRGTAVSGMDQAGPRCNPFRVGGVIGITHPG